MAKKIIESVPEKKTGRWAKIRPMITRKRLIIVGIVILALMYISNKINSGVPSVEIAHPERKDIVQSVSASGKIDADEKATLTFQSGGKLGYVGVAEGDKVTKGTLLARLDTTALYTAYLQSQYNLRSAQAALNNVYDQVKGHEKDESYTQIQTRTTAEVARDNAFQANVAAQNALSNASLYSPIDGTVSKVNPDTIGINITPANSSYEVFDPATLYFNVEVNEVDIPKVVIDQSVEVNLDAFPGEVLTGKVTNIGYANILTSTGGTAYKVHIKIVPDGKSLRLGMNGNADIVIGKVSNVISVPATSLVEDGDKRYVWVDDNGIARKKEVKIGVESIDWSEIQSGVTEEDNIILTPAKDLKDGGRIKVAS